MSSPRPHRKTVFALIVVGSLVALIAVFAVWAKRQLLETETWKETSTELLEDEAIRDQVSTFMVETLFTQGDVNARIEEALPPRAAPAAGVISGAARRLADDLAVRALESPRVQQLWADANERAHARLLEVVEKGAEGDVTLDLSEIVGQLGDQLGVDVASRLPPGAGEITILETDQLQSAQKAIDLLQTLAWVLTALTFLLFGLAIYLAKGWRRVALRDVGFAFFAVGILTLAARNLAGGAVTDSLASTAAVEPAVDATWAIGTSVLRDIGGAMLFNGLVIVLGAWLAGPGRVGRAARRELAPLLERRGTAYAALLVLLLVLFWWAPTPGFTRLPVSILIIVLFVIGLEALRSQAIKDFPEETLEAGAQRWSQRASSVFDRGSRTGS